MAIAQLFALGQKGKSAVVTAQRHVNLYAEINQQGDKGALTFYGTPGLKLDYSYGDTPVRGSIVQGDFKYEVHRGTLWQVDNAGIRVERGVLNTVEGRVSMSSNGVQIGIVDGVNYYVYVLDKQARIIQSLTNVGLTATLTTTEPHFRYTGETITISGSVPVQYNGTFVITVTGPNTLTYTMLANPVTPVALSSITHVTTAATATTASPHGLATGNIITISGASPAAYNGTFTITVTSPTVFTYTMLSDPGTAATVTGVYVGVTKPATAIGTYSIASSLIVVTDNLVGTPIDITFGDGYFILGYADGKFQITSAYDGTTLDALDYATAESNPDGLVRVLYDHGELVLLGSSTVEFWSNTGGQDFPYSNQRGSTLQFGLAAKYSLVQYNDSIAALMKNSMGQVQVMMMRGHAVVAISSQEVDSILNNYSAVADATAFGYMLGGHPMYQTSFPSANKSWLYDASTQLWSELESGLSGDRHRAAIQVDYVNKTRVTDYSNGNVYTLDANEYTDNGMPIAREIITKTMTIGQNQRIAVHRVGIDVETGNGIENGQGSVPQVMMQVSKDSGRTWGNEIWSTSGKIGQYLVRLFWTRLGSSRFWTLKWRITDPVKVVLTFTDAETDFRK